MKKIDLALQKLNELDQASQNNQWMNKYHPLVKFCLPFLYMIFVLSFSIYDFWGILSMCLFPFIVFQLSEISFTNALQFMKIPMYFVIFLSIWNPVFHQNLFVMFGNVPITYGFLSMICLLLKGFLTLLGAFILISLSSMDEICYSLSFLHVPTIIITIVLLIHRYIRILLLEVGTTLDAYSLRAPNQNGIHWKYWGSMVGQILLRSISTADEIYQSMQLRGFQGTLNSSHSQKLTSHDFILLFFMCLLFLTFRIFPVLTMIGSLFLS